MPPSPNPHPPVEPSFEEVWESADGIPGWLTAEQALLLFEHARALPDGACVVEIGSHRGRSTVVLGAAVRPHSGMVVAVDPFVEGRLFGGRSTRDHFEANVREHGLPGTVQLRPEYSTRLRPSWDTPIDLLYIDGKHDYWTLSDDLRWSVHLPPSGRVLIHDCFSSIGVTLGVIAHVLPSKDLAYVGREGSLAVFERRAPSATDRWRMLAEVPWWLRNVGIKILLRLRLRPLARLVGHDSPYDPF